jgi:tRNA(Glu) U13 pseudouridine synthase TruD
MTTLALQNQLAGALGVANSAVQFPALKDKQAVTAQFGTVRAAGPNQVKGRGFVAERVGWLNWPLSPGDVAGNRFSVVLRDLKARALKKAYLGRGTRALLLLPQDLAWGTAQADERFVGQLKLTVRFFLPRGSYATLLLKAVESGRALSMEHTQSPVPKSDDQKQRLF